MVFSPRCLRALRASALRWNRCYGTRIGPVSQNSFPPGWDEERARRAAAHYDNLSEEDALIEDEKPVEGETLMSIPHDLVPKVRELIAKRRG